MKLKLEELEYQQTAISSVTRIFEGTTKNNFDNASVEGLRRNFCQLSDAQIVANITSTARENNIADADAKISLDVGDVCIEMETGTGKTLVYVKTIYELHRQYGFTKFIILVPSIAIRQGVLGTLKTFEKQLADIYGFRPNYFEYDSKRLSKVKSFAEEQHPQIMIMTTAAIVGDDKILNREAREGLFNNTPFVELLAATRPIVIMDEPQEGMDAEKTKEFIARLDPLVKLRYSATHKEISNLVYRLTPYDSYRQNLVKKIQVLTVSEKNDEATLKIELSQIQNGRGEPKVKLKAWRLKGGKYVFDETAWLKVKDNLAAKTENPSYLNYQISRIHKKLSDGKWRVEFANGAEIMEQQANGNREIIWALQLEWLIRRHFEKTQTLAADGIKCLSLIFIDRVANYTDKDARIKHLFVEKYRELYPQFHDGATPDDAHIAAVQGSYFAKRNGDFTDDENSMLKSKEIYELILRGKEELLKLSNPVQFVFSHTALGVGWDNPNVFNIATLNTSYSEPRKRQQIGRGLRICVNQNGERVPDPPEAADAARINQLTVIPNETRDTFLKQYQTEIAEVYGDASQGAELTFSHKGQAQDKVAFKLNPKNEVQTAFRRFWRQLARETDYAVAFDEAALIERSVAELNKITIAEMTAHVSASTIDEMTAAGFKQTFQGSEDYRLRARFSPLDLLEELSESTRLSYPTLLAIISKLDNHDEWVKNPPRFMHEAVKAIRRIETDEMLRGLTYELTGDELPFEFADFEKQVSATSKYVDTPRRGVFDRMLIDSTNERNFAIEADAERNDEVLCFIKLPAYYKIKTPIGSYNPDFGVVWRRKRLTNNDETEFYFVVEVKGTNDLTDTSALKDDEIYKIKCAMKHFKALGIETRYKAPIKDYEHFGTEVEKEIGKLVEGKPVEGM